MPFVLEGAHALKRDPATDVDVGRGDVDPELHPERTPEGELRFERAGGKDVNGVPGELGAAHGATRASRAPR